MKTSLAAPCVKLLAVFLSALFCNSLIAQQVNAYIPNNGAGTVSVVNTYNNTVTATLTVGTSPRSATVAPDGSKVYVVNGGGSLSIINAVNNTTLNTITLNSSPHSVAILPDGSKAYVTNFGLNRLHIINGTTNVLQTSVTTGSGPSGLAVNPDGTRLYVSCTNANAVYVYNTANNVLLASIPVPGGPSSIAFATDGSKAYVVTASNNSVSVINPVNNTVSGTISVGTLPQGIAIHPDGSRLFVTNGTSNTLSVVSTLDNSIIATISGFGSPNGVAVTPDGSKVFVANNATNTVSVVSAASNTIIGTVNVGTSPVAWGKFIGTLAPTGTHLNFDGINDYASAPGLSVASQSFSIEFWAQRQGGLGTSQYLLSQGASGTGNFVGVQFRLNNMPAFSFGGDDLDGTTAITDLSWHHYAVTYDAASGQQSLYLDGVLNASRIAQASTTASGTFYLGGNLGANENFNGNLDEVRVWNYVLSADEIARRKNCEVQVAEIGLVRYYKFNQGSAAGDNPNNSVITDVKAGNHSTLYNFALTGNSSNWLSGSPLASNVALPSAPVVTSPVNYGIGATASALTASGTSLTWYTSATGGTGSATAPTPNTATAGTASYWVASSNANGCQSVRTKVDVMVGTTGTSLRFDGTNDYINCGTKTAYDFTAGTITAWLKPASSSNNRVIVANRTAANTTQTRWSFHLNQNTGMVGIYNGTAFTSLYAGPFVANTWYHLALVFNETSTDVFINGLLAGTIAAGINTASTGNALLIGATDLSNAYPAEYWAGEMDELRIYNRALPAEEIIRTRNCELQGNESGLVSYYKLNNGAGSGNNAGLTTAVDASGNAFNGTLTGFALTGAISNWLAGSPITSGVTLPAAPIVSPQSFCGGTTVASLIPAPSSTANWYSVSSNGSILSSSYAIPSSDTYYVTATKGVGCESTRTPVILTINPTSIASSDQSSTLVISGATDFPSCLNQIARVLPDGASPISGSTTARVWVGGATGTSYVQRHYEITPASNASTATGRVTLYFTQAEFDAFNLVNPIKLPIGPADISGIANLLIEKRGGTSSDGTGLPETYPGAALTINPSDANIIWNASTSRWEVSFDVAGFSGFFVKTNSFILPLNWLSVTVSRDQQQQAQVKWKVSEENVLRYDIERSADARTFTQIGALPSRSNGTNQYVFGDPNRLSGVAYYRIRQTDRNGAVGYSRTVKLSEQGSATIAVWPNPVKDKVIVTVGMELLRTKAYLQDVQGRILQTRSIENLSFPIHMSGYTSGVYILRFEDGTTLKLVK